MEKELYFKKGDIVVPRPGRKSSYDHKFSKDLVLECMNDVKDDQSYYTNLFRIVEGYTNYVYGGKSAKGEHVYLYPTALQLQNQIKELYPIF